MGVLLNDKVLVTFKGRSYGQRILLTLWYECIRAAPGGESLNLSMQKLRSLIKAGGAFDIETPYMKVLGNDYTLLEIKTQVIAPTRAIYFTQAITNVGNGGDQSVANDSAALTLRCDLAGRKFVGTKHIGPVPDGASVSGLLTVGYKADLSNLGDALVLPLTPLAPDAQYRPILFHRADLTSSPVTSFAIGDQSRVQRRRTVGLGE